MRALRSLFLLRSSFRPQLKQTFPRVTFSTGNPTDSDPQIGDLLSFLDDEKAKRKKNATGLTSILEKSMRQRRREANTENADHFEDLESDEIEVEENPMSRVHSALAAIEEELSDLTPSQDGATADDEFQKHSKLEKALVQVLQYEDFRATLPLWQLYPKTAKKWLTYVATPAGYFNPIGRWQTVDAFADSSIRPEPVHEKSLSPRAELPADLVGKYRLGVQPHEVANLSEGLKRLLSFEFASQSEVTEFRKTEVRKQFRREPADTGSPEVQIAILTVQINALSDHLLKHKKDIHSRRGLQLATSKRKAQMEYLKRKNPAKYYQVISAMKIPDLPVGPGPRFIESKERLEQRLREAQRRRALLNKAPEVEKQAAKAQRKKQ